MSIESSIEQQIQAAIKRGDFDDLAGKGKPIDLDAYFAAPEELRLAFSMLRSNDFVPEEVEMLKAIAELKESIRLCTDEGDKRLLAKALNEKTLALRLRLESLKRTK